MEDNTNPQNQPTVDERAEYIRKVEAGEIKPSPEELKGFLPKQSLSGGSFTGRRAVQAQEQAQERVQEKIDATKGPITSFAQSTGLVETPRTEQTRVKQAGISAAEELQATDLENATAGLMDVIRKDPMFFRGMKIHKKIAAGEKVFEMQDGLLTEKGKEDLADYDYFYNHTSRGITFAHGASQMLIQLGSDISDTVGHLVGDATPVINPEYKNSKNYAQIESEARNFIMLAVQNRISIDELNSGKVDEDRLIKFASQTSQDIREARKTRQAILSTFKAYTNPPEQDIDGTKIKPKPIFLPATTWQSAKNKAAGAFEAGVRVLKGWGDLALDSSKDPLSVHGTSEDAAVLSGLMQASGSAAPGAPFGGHPSGPYGGYPNGNPLPPEEREKLLRIAADRRNITAARLNKAADDIAHLNKWASGEIMVMGDRGVIPGPNPDPLVWSPGQTWADPLMLYGMGSGIFRALRTASRAEAAMAARYAALQAAAAPEKFSFELANVTRLFSGMGGMLEDIGRQYADTIGADASKMTATDFANLGLRHLVDKPFEAFKLINISPAFVDEFLNAIPKPEKIAMTAEEWQLLPGVEKLKNLEIPASFAGVENGADIWNKMNPQQRMKILIAERASEIHRLARERQAAAIAEATRAGTEAVQATAEANGNASVARRTAGAATSAFGEWVMGGRTLGNGFWRDMSFAGLFNSTANVIDSTLDFVGAGFGTTGKETAEYIKDMFRTRTVFKSMYALGAFAGLNIVGKDEESMFIKYPRYLVNAVFLMSGMRTLGYTAKNIGDFMRVWGDEIARGDPTLYRSYAAKIAKNPDSYPGIDKDLVFGPAGIAKFMSLGPENILRLSKRMLYDFGVKGGGVAEAIVYGKDRESLGQGFAIGTAFSGVGYSVGMAAAAGLGKNKLNAMRSDSMWRMLAMADGDPSNVLNFIDAHNQALKGGYEKDFLGAFLGIDNSTAGKVRFIDDKMAAVMRFAYDYGLKEQSENIRKSVSLGYKTPEDIIGQTIREQAIRTEVATVTNKLNGEAATIETNIAGNRDIAKQLTEKLKDPRLSTEERTDISAQKMAVQEKIKQDAKRLAEIKNSLKTGDPVEFLRNNGVDIDTINVRVRAGVNKLTGNNILTFRGLTIETTKDGPIVYINKDKMNTQALWHEAAEAVLIAGGVDSVLNSAVGTLWGNVAKDPQVIKDNRAIYEEAVKNGEDVNTLEFITKLKKPTGGVLNDAYDMVILSQMLDAHMRSAGLDETWKQNAIMGIREYYMTGNMVGIEAITREIVANHTGLYLEGKSPLTLYNNGSVGMTLDAITDKVFNFLVSDTRIQLDAQRQLYNTAGKLMVNDTPAENIRHFFVDPATGKRVPIAAFDRIAREVIRRANSNGIDKEGKMFIDLRKMKPNERKIWAASNNVEHWLDQDGNLRDPKEIIQVEADMTAQSLTDLDTFRDANPTLVRSTKKVTNNKKGESTTTIDGVFSPQEIMSMLQNPGLPANIKNTLMAYAKAMYRPDGKIALMQGIYSGESKEVVYTPNSDPKLREWGSPLLVPEHRSLLPQSLSIAYEKGADGTVTGVRVRVNGLDWKAVEQRVIIAAGSDLARNHSLGMSELYGLMDQYVKNLNKGVGNTDPATNAIPSAKLFDPDGKNPQKGADIRDLMHFIFDFQKKKNDAYINQPQDWGELGLRGPTHPYTSFRADRWVDAQSGEAGQFVRVNEAAYRLSQGNFMGDESGPPKRKLNKKDVSETTPEKEAAAVEKATAGAPDVPAPTEKGKFINVEEPLSPNVDDIFGRINDIYAFDGEVVPKLVTKWLEESTTLQNFKGESIIINTKNIAHYVDQVISYIEREAKNSKNKNAQDRAQYVLPKFKELAAKIERHRSTKKGIEDAEAAAVRDLDNQARQAENQARQAAMADPEVSKTDPLAGVDTTTTKEVSKKLAKANDDIQLWKEYFDDGDIPLPPGEDAMMKEFQISERPYYLKELKKALDVAYSLKPDFNPGFDIYKYLPDYVKPDADPAVQARLKAEAEQVRAAQQAATPTAGADTKLVGELKSSMQDTLSAIRVLRKAGEKNMPMDIDDAFNRSSMVGKGIERLFDVLEGKKGTVDYEYSAGVAKKYIEGIDALIVANDKKLLAASKKKDQAEIDMRSQYKLQLMDIKKTLEGVYEYTSGIAETAPIKQKPAPAATEVSLEARKEYRNGAVISNKNAPWVEGIPSKVEKPLGEAVLKLAEEIIDIEGKGLTAEETTYFYKKLKAAKDAGVTAEQFWTMYELDNKGSREILGFINEYAKRKDGQELFPYVAKKNRPNLLAPEDVARAAIERDKPKEAKPKEAKPAPTTERPYWEDRIDALGDIITTETYPGEDLNGVKKGATKNEHIRANTEYLYRMFKEGKVTYEQIIDSLRSRKGDDAERVTPKGEPADKKEIARSIAYFETHWKNLVAQDKKNQPAPAAEPAKPAPEAKPKEAKPTLPIKQPEGSQVNPNYADFTIIGVSTPKGFEQGDIAQSTYKISNSSGATYIVYARDYWQTKTAGDQAKPAPAAEPAKPAPEAAKPKETKTDDGVVLGNNPEKWPKNYQRADEIISAWFNNHTILRTAPENRYQKPTWQKDGAMEAAESTIAELEKEGITPAMARKIFIGYEDWRTSGSKWDGPALQRLHNWITSDIQGGAKPKPKTAQEIPPELAPTTEPTTTSKPKWDAKKANKLASDMVDIIEKWEDAYGNDGDTSTYDDKIYDIIDKLADMGMNRREIESLLGDNSSVETSEGTVGIALDDKFGGAQEETPKTGAGTGQPPPKKPRPTAQGAGDEDAPEPAPKPKPKPVVPKRDPIVIPDAPENKGETFEWEDVSDPKKDPYEIKKKYGPIVRKLIDDGFTKRLTQFDKDIKKATEVILSKNPTTKDLENARMALKVILNSISDYESSDISDFGISHFDRSPAVRFRFFEIFDSGLSDWFSKEQKKRLKNAYAEIDKAQKKLDAIHEDRVIADFIAMTDATDITGARPGQVGKSTEKVLATKQPWQMADDRDLLPLTNRINDFIVAERFIPVDTDNGRPGTSGLIFIDTKQTTPKGDNALKTILNSLAVGSNYSFVGVGYQGFYDIKVINANGDVKNFRISSDGSRGLDPATLKKLYAEKYAEWQKAMKDRSPGDPFPSIRFDVQGTSYGANKNGVALMNIEIAEFLRSGQESFTLSQQREANRQQAAQRKKDRQEQAAARDAQRAKELADAAAQRQLTLGLYNRQPVDPNNPETAMEAVEKDKRVVSRRKDTLVEVHKGKGKDGEFFRVYYTGQEFGGPREVFKSNSLEASLNLAQSFTPFEGYRTAILSLIEGYPIDKAGPWMDKNFQPTTDPKLAAPLSVIFEKYEKEFTNALRRIRASGTYGLVDAGNGEYIVVPKKPIRDKNGSLDTDNPITKISRKLVLKAMDFATQAETEKATRQQANAALPMPRQQPGSPVPQPAPAFDITSFISDRASLILQNARSESLKAKTDAVTGVAKILTNRDNYKVMFMKNGTIRVYGANNNLLAVTDDEDEAFGWLTR